MRVRRSSETSGSALYDFTAVGDVVNTASRLQTHAAGGEVVLSQRVADGLPAPVGNRVELEMKGKPKPEVAYRFALLVRFRSDGSARRSARGLRSDRSTRWRGGGDTLRRRRARLSMCVSRAVSLA